MNSAAIQTSGLAKTHDSQVLGSDHVWTQNVCTRHHRLVRFLHLSVRVRWESSYLHWSSSNSSDP